MDLHYVSEIGDVTTDLIYKGIMTPLFASQIFCCTQGVTTDLIYKGIMTPYGAGCFHGSGCVLQQT